MKLWKLKSLNLIILFIGCISCVSCQKGDKTFTEALQTAETLMTKRPDSALWLLENAVPSESLTGKEHADWCLLLTQARDKNYIKHTSDSLISIAVDYYERQKDPHRLMLSYYYMGRVSQDIGDANRAQGYYKKALELEKDVDDDYLLALVNSHIGMLYVRLQLPEQALRYLEDANVNMEKAGDKQGQSFVLRDLGRLYQTKNELDQAIIYYQQALELADTLSRSSILLELGSRYTEKRDFTLAYQHLHQALSCAADSTSYYTACLAFGKLFVTIEEPDSAVYYLNQSIKSSLISTQAASYWYKSILAERKQNWKEYADLNSKYMDLQGVITELKLTETLHRTEELYNYQLIKKEAELSHTKERLHKQNQTIILLVGFILIALLTILVFYSHRKKRNLNIQYMEVQQELEKITLSKKTKDSDFCQTDIYIKFHTTGDLGKITEQDIIDLIAQIDEIYPTFRKKMHSVIPALAGKDLKLCYYLKANLGTTNISRICSCDKSTISSQKKKIYNIVKEKYPGFPNLDEFIESI